MAETREIANLDKVRLDELEQGSPQWKQKKKLIAEEEWRKKNSVVAEQWIEYHHNSSSSKGGKVLLKKKMKDIVDRNGKVLKAGGTYSQYLGRLKKGGLDAIHTYAKKGVKVRLGAEHFKYLQKD